MEKYILNAVSSNFVYFHKLRMGFSELKTYNNNKLLKSSILIDRFAPVVEKMIR